VSAQAGISSMAVDDRHLYWSVSGTAVRRAPASGGAPSDIASGQVVPSSVVTDGAFVYWVTYDGALRARATSGTGAVLDLATELGVPRMVALEGDCAYVATASPAGRILRIAKP
jgi:hypothetical protein